MLTMNAGSRLILYLDCIFKLPENDRFVRQLWENRSGYNNDNAILNTQLTQPIE